MTNYPEKKEHVVTRIQITLPDLDDCDRATFVGLVAQAVARDDDLKRALDFRRIRVVEVADADPYTEKQGTPGAVRVTVGWPATIEAAR